MWVSYEKKMPHFWEACSVFVVVYESKRNETRGVVNVTEMSTKYISNKFHPYISEHFI